MIAKLEVAGWLPLANKIVVKFMRVFSAIRHLPFKNHAMNSFMTLFIATFYCLAGFSALVAIKAKH